MFKIGDKVKFKKAEENRAFKNFYNKVGMVIDYNPDAQSAKQQFIRIIWGNKRESWIDLKATRFKKYINER